MPLYRLPREPVFPDPARAEPDGLLAVGGDLSPERLLVAYASGIFPWFEDDTPILWWSPDPRLVLEPARLHVPRSLRRTLRRGQYRLTADREQSVRLGPRRVRKDGLAGKPVEGHGANI